MGRSETRGYDISYSRGWKEEEKITTKKGHKRIKSCLLGTINTLVPLIAVHVIKVINNSKYEYREHCNKTAQ